MSDELLDLIPQLVRIKVDNVYIVITQRGDTWVEYYVEKPGDTHIELQRQLILEEDGKKYFVARGGIWWQARIYLGQYFADC